MSWAEVKKINSDMNKPLNEVPFGCITKGTDDIQEVVLERSGYNPSNRISSDLRFNNGSNYTFVSFDKIYGNACFIESYRKSSGYFVICFLKKNTENNTYSRKGFSSTASPYTYECFRLAWQKGNDIYVCCASGTRTSGSSSYEYKWDKYLIVKISFSSDLSSYQISEEYEFDPTSDIAKYIYSYDSNGYTDTGTPTLCSTYVINNKVYLMTYDCKTLWEFDGNQWTKRQYSFSTNRSCKGLYANGFTAQSMRTLNNKIVIAEKDNSSKPNYVNYILFGPEDDSFETIFTLTSSVYANYINSAYNIDNVYGRKYCPGILSSIFMVYNNLIYIPVKYDSGSSSSTEYYNIGIVCDGELSITENIECINSTGRYLLLDTEDGFTWVFIGSTSDYYPQCSVVTNTYIKYRYWLPKGKKIVGTKAFNDSFVALSDNLEPCKNEDGYIVTKSGTVEYMAMNFRSKHLVY